MTLNKLLSFHFLANSNSSSSSSTNGPTTTTIHFDPLCQFCRESICHVVNLKNSCFLFRFAILLPIIIFSIFLVYTSTRPCMFSLCKLRHSSHDLNQKPHIVEENERNYKTINPKSLHKHSHLFVRVPI